MNKPPKRTHHRPPRDDFPGPPYGPPGREARPDRTTGPRPLTRGPSSTPPEDAGRGLTLLRAFLSGWDESLLPGLVQDYHRLFIGLGDVLAPPWESVYLGADHLLFEAPTLAVRQFYARFGLQAPRLNNEPDDHLGLELGFVVHLCALALRVAEEDDTAALDRHLQALREFLRDHLLRWAPDCFARTLEHARTDYYRGVATLARGTLTEIAGTLGLKIPAGVFA